MLGPVVEDAIEGMAGDRTSSASRLARVGLETMALATMEGPAWRDPKVLAEAARRISEAQPAMAIVHNVVHLFARLVAEGQEPMAVLREIHGELDTARERIGKTFLKIAADSATVLTLSFSESVRACLLAAHGKRRIARVIVLESGPSFEGRSMAKVLAEDGMTATAVPDELGRAKAAESTYVLVGADAVLRDGSVVNRRGTRGIAQAAADIGRPVYIASESLKFDTRFDASTWHDPRETDLFEVTPSGLVTTVVTERGTYTPDTIRTMMAQANIKK